MNINDSKFNDKAAAYEKARPNYAAQIVKCIMYDYAKNVYICIADIGSGTGKLTEMLLKENNIVVYGVEPNSEMRSVAEKKFAKKNNFISIRGYAENTMLNDKSADIIVSAQAFHWFDQAAFKIECKRILKSGGLENVNLIWNKKDFEDEIVIETTEIYKKFCPNYKNRSGGIENQQINEFYDGRFEMKIFENNLIFNEENFIAMNLSQSYAPTQNNTEYDDYIKEIKAVFYKHCKNDTVTIKNSTIMYRGLR